MGVNLETSTDMKDLEIADDAALEPIAQEERADTSVQPSKKTIIVEEEKPKKDEKPPPAIGPGSLIRGLALPLRRHLPREGKGVIIQFSTSNIKALPIEVMSFPLTSGILLQM